MGPRFYSVNTNDPQELRDRAAELRAQAQAMEDGYSRAIMLVLASDCDQLADRAEERAKKMGISARGLTRK